MPLSETASITLFHATRSRSFRVLWFLEELGEPYRIEPVDLEKNEQKSERLLRHNPMGKVPVVLDGDVALSESGAIYVYLADKYAPGRLAPPPRRTGRHSAPPAGIGDGRCSPQRAARYRR